MGLILDTNALSAFVDGDRSLLPLLRNSADLSLPVIALGEYLFGIRQSRMRQRYEQWLSSNLMFFEIREIGPQTADHYATIRRELKTAGNPIPTNDLWIAAIAREHQLDLVTKDNHFNAVPGLKTLPW